MDSGRDSPGSGYKKYLLTLLLVILAFNYVDRLALGLLLQNIKLDLDLSDTQLGFLTGIAFALFYSVMGIPIARWADRGNRVAIISLTAGLWSIAVALCGAAGNFIQLLCIRVGVAVGEAGCIPPAHSLIAEHFTRAERPRAAAIYMLGWPIALMIGYFVAGWLNELYGWRTTFMLLGLPGLVLALLAWTTLREPRKERATNAASHALSAVDSSSGVAREPTIKQVCATLWRSRAFRHMLFSFSITSFFAYGILQWLPAFFIRSYGLPTGTVGSWFALIWGVGGFIGTYIGGEWASRHAANNERLQLQVMAIIFVAVGLNSACIYLSSSYPMSLALMTFTAMALSGTNGPIFSTVQSLVPERMRAMSVALLYLFANLIGMGLGPLAAGMLSDAYRPWAGDESLRYALLSLCPGFLWSAWHVWQGSRSVADELEVLELQHPLQPGLNSAADASRA